MTPSDTSRVPQITPYRRQDPESQAALIYEPYRASVERGPRQPLIPLPQTLSEVTGPLFGHGDIQPTDNDLTRQHAGAPVGQRIILCGRVLDDGGRPVPNALIEIWQANAAGRYTHKLDQHDAPLDPNFTGTGRTLTDAQGHYRFLTILPGAYPWRNHPNAWRPRHIHLSLFGTAFVTRFVTQMYFAGDPLLPYDPLFNSVRDERARARTIAQFDLERTEPDWALAYRFDVVLRGREATPFEGR